MKKVAIVGVEGSGKTVMLAGLGDLYARPDENGYFLAPKNYATASYVTEKISRMRKGEWPVATAEDVLQGLDWTLKRSQGERVRPKEVCEVSCLDFAGEVYRLAFGIRQDAIPTDLVDEVSALKKYIRNADDLIVLINLRDVIAQGADEPRVQEAMWITNEILSYALNGTGGRKAPRAVIVLSQADSYAETIASCGGALGVLQRYLPHVAYNYSWLDILTASAVDKTELNDDGNEVPAPDFQPTKLRVIMGWIRAGLESAETTSTVGPDAQLHFHCPRCYEKIEAAPDMVGSEGVCPTCESKIVVPPPAFTPARPPRPSPPRKPSPRKPSPRQPSPPVVQRPSGIWRHFTFTGRRNRAEYWKSLGYFVILFGVSISFLAGVEGSIEANGGESGGGEMFIVLAPVIASLVFFMSNIVRRLHDFNARGIWGLFSVFPPTMVLSLIIIGIIPGTEGDNNYGPEP